MTCQDPQRTPHVRHSVFRGHTAPPLTLDLDTVDTPSRLLSGSEDCTVKLWDIHSAQTPILHIPGFDTDTATVLFDPDSNGQVCFVGSGCEVYEFDLRLSNTVSETTTPLISLNKSHKFSSGSVINIDDEINQIFVTNHHIAAVTDAGRIAVYDRRQRLPLKKQFKTSHDNLATCITFRPSRNDEIWTGGMDSKLMRWDLATMTRTRETDMRAQSNDQGGQSFNPPFVNSLAFSESGRFLVAGLGDGSLYLEDMIAKRITKGRDEKNINLKKGQQQQDQKRPGKFFRDGHSWSVTRVQNLQGSKILSGGLDGKLCIWSLSTKNSKAPARLNLLSTTHLDTKFNCLAAYRSNDALCVFTAGVPINPKIPSSGNVDFYKIPCE